MFCLYIAPVIACGKVLCAQIEMIDRPVVLISLVFSAEGRKSGQMLYTWRMLLTTSLWTFAEKSCFLFQFIAVSHNIDFD